MQQPQSIRVHLAGLAMSLAGLSRAIVRSAPVAAVALALLPAAVGASPLTGGWNHSRRRAGRQGRLAATLVATAAVPQPLSL